MNFFSRKQQIFWKHSFNYGEKIFVRLQAKKTSFELEDIQKGVQ